MKKEKYIVNSHNEWDKLEEVIIGTVFDHEMNGLDMSFRLFFHDNLYGQDLVGCNYDKNVEIKKQYVKEMYEDLEGVVDILKDYGCIVHRPRTPKKVTPVNTPYWKSTDFYALNVRDQTIIIGDDIIETPPCVRYRYFENDLMKHIFFECFKNGSKWTVAPRPLLLNSSFDISYVYERSSDDIKEWYEELSSEEHEMSYGNEIIFDAANCMRFNDIILMNAVTENQMLGAQWLQQHLGNDYKVVTAKICDSHIDDSIVPLREGLALVDWTHFNDVNEFPEFLKDWDIIEAPVVEHEEYDYDINDIMLASKSIDTNVLSLDPNTIICHDTTHKHFEKLLKPYGIECVPARMRHSRIFSGAFHCTSLDLRRSN